MLKHTNQLYIHVGDLCTYLSGTLTCVQIVPEAKKMCWFHRLNHSDSDSDQATVITPEDKPPKPIRQDTKLLGCEIESGAPAPWMSIGMIQLYKFPASLESFSY